MAAATISAAVKVPVTSRVEPAAEAAQTKAVAPTTLFLSRTKLGGKVQSRRVTLRAHKLRPVFASTTESSAANSLADSVVPEVAALEDVPDDAPKRKVSPLARGGTLEGSAAAGKDPAPSTLGKSAVVASGKFSDPRWINGTWDLTQFMKDGKPDWDAVIDAEVVRRKWLEDNPQTSSNDDPVVFETGSVPWWAWTKRFHLPEAERLNGRAAMLGFFAAYLVDAATGVGLVDQMGSFFGKLLLLLTVVGTLLIRKNEDLDNIKNLADEWTFYDKQWQATWKDTPRPSEASKDSDVPKP